MSLKKFGIPAVYGVYNNRAWIVVHERVVRVRFRARLALVHYS